MQKLLTIIISGMIIYSLAKNYLQKENSVIIEKKAKSESTNNEGMHGSFFEKTLSTVLINVLNTDGGKEFVAKMIKPQYSKGSMSNISTPVHTITKKEYNKTADQIFNIETKGESLEGKGPVICGHSVRAKYKIYRAEDNIIVEEGTKIFSLGTRDTLLGLESAIVGMYIGQTRHVYIPADFSKTSKPSKDKKTNVAYKADVTLLDIIPQTFLSGEDIKIFDDQKYTNRPYLCGSSARFDLKISKLNGEVIYNTMSQKNNSVNMLVGDMNYPIVISYALFNRAQEGNHTIIAPGKYFRSFGNKNSNKIFPQEQLPEEEFFIMEIFSQ